MSLITDQHRLSANSFVFADTLNVTVNKEALTISDQGGPEDEEVYGHNLRSVYVLVLENESKAFLVYEGALSGHYVHYELEDAPIGGFVFERFLGFLTTHMPCISNINQSYIANLGLKAEITLKQGWRLSFDEHDYNKYPNGPTRTKACQNPYIIV
jgi:hypothetical protein